MGGKSKKVKDADSDEENNMYVQLKEINKEDEKTNKKKAQKNANNDTPNKNNINKSKKNKKNKKDDSDSDEQNSDEDNEIKLKSSIKESISQLQDIKDVQGFMIKQLWSPCEIFTGCQTENHYYIYPSNNSDEEINEETTMPILKSIENSNCCIRNILSGRCRPFEMMINTQIQDGESELNEKVILFLKRSFKCTFYCYQRPVIEVYQIKKGIHFLVGRVQNPFFCTRLSVEVLDKEDVLLYSMDSSCCKCAFICQNFGCQACQQMEFDVKDHEGNEFTQIKKINSGCCVSCISDTSKYFIDFPDDTSNAHKLLLLTATILIDYMYFEGGSKICLNI